MAEISLDPTRLALWDDNPSTLDLLGFKTVADPITKALQLEKLDPLTIGIHSPWGGGKTTMLGLLEEELSTKPEYIVIRVNPWEFDDFGDVRGSLIAEVISTLEHHFDGNAPLKEKATELMNRISWARVGTMVAKGAITMQWNPKEIVEAFTPKAREKPESMTGFRSSFGEFLGMMPDIKRVIVLVDDLDRCLPDAVMATLEAIKLFLSVPKMTFILAADRDMVSDAIAASLDATGRSDVFASRYLEKIIQLPVSLPRLTLSEAENYIALLLVIAGAGDNDVAPILEHAQQRRLSGTYPLLGDLDRLEHRPHEGILQLAARLAQGMSAQKLSNPRYVKRFLNAFAIRNEVARAQGIELEPGILAKLYLLEDRYSKDFETFVGTAAADREALLANWEAWGRGENEDKPEKVTAESRDWAATEPALAGKSLDNYLALAASLTDIVSGAVLNDQNAKHVKDLASTSEAVRRGAHQQIAGLASAEKLAIITALFGSARRADSIEGIVSSALGLAKANPELASNIAAGIRESCWSRLDAGMAVEIANAEQPEIRALAGELAADTTIDPMVANAARMDAQA